MHQNMSLRPNGVNPMCLLRKITTWLRGTNFCTSSARFALSFVRQPNGPKCIQIVQNTPKHEFRVKWSGSGAFVVKNSDATSWHEQFAPSFVRQTNGPECTQIERNAPKRKFRVQWGESGAFVAKNSDATSWHGLLHQVGPFCIECCNATKLAQMHPNSTKRNETWC